MLIVNMATLPSAAHEQAADILAQSLPLGWKDRDEAMAEINELMVPENVLLAALEHNCVIGWGGILPIYHGRAFELHPLAVREDVRHMGVGRALVAALEARARVRGGATMWIGADDERDGGETSFANVDLYEDFASKLRDFDPGSHAAAFYMKLGYVVMGAMPDANGPGKPDIFLAKRL